MTEKQLRFSEEYLIDLNATQAALRAGYSQKTAYSIGQRLLTYPEVQSHIQKLMDKRSEKTAITADFVLMGLKEVALRCMSEKRVMEWNYEERCMEQKTDSEGNGVWEFDSAGANKALELLGRHLKLFNDKVIHAVDTDVEITIKGKKFD